VLRLVPINLDAVINRAQSLATSMISGDGLKSFTAKIKAIVADDYAAAFSNRGRRFKESWRTTKGPVTLVGKKDGGGFRRSFQSLDQKTSPTGMRVVIEFASASYVHSRMGEDYIKLIRDGLTLSRKGAKKEIKLKVKLKGSTGGISRGAEKKVMKEFRRVVRDQGRKKGYRVK
jgi:hypothetical protein